MHLPPWRLVLVSAAQQVEDFQVDSADRPSELVDLRRAASRRLLVGRREALEVHRQDLLAEGDREHLVRTVQRERASLLTCYPQPASHLQAFPELPQEDHVSFSLSVRMHG